MRTIALVPLFIAALTGCAIAEQDFPAAYADATCAKLRQCNEGDFDNTYDDMADCEEQWREGAEDFADGADFLYDEYDPGQGRECVASIRSGDCADFSTVGFNEAGFSGDCDPADVWGEDG